MPYTQMGLTYLCSDQFRMHLPPLLRFEFDIPYRIPLHLCSESDILSINLTQPSK